MHAPLPAIDAERLRALVRARIRDVPDFPKPGILFRDIRRCSRTRRRSRPRSICTSMIANLVSRLGRSRRREREGHPRGVDKVVGVESRGFLFGMALAHRIGAGFVLVRKPGKLPLATVEATYALEYGEDRLQITRTRCRPASAS